MTEFEAVVIGGISLVALATFIVMLAGRPGEIRKEKFEKRDW